MPNYKKKKINTILMIGVVFVFILIICFTLQNKASTESLSNSLTEVLKKSGISFSEKHIRSNAHLIEYFVLGVFLSLYGLINGLSEKKIFTIGFALGAFDECLRIVGEAIYKVYSGIAFCYRSGR